MVTSLLLAFCLTVAGDLPVPPDEDPLKLNDEMKQFLDANIDRSSDSLQQLHQLVRMVFQQNALNFVYVSKTRSAIETFSKRGGNCVSFTFLFIAMARHLDLDARFREVDIAPIWSRVGDIVSMSGHANAAVFIGSQGYVVDLFPRVDRIQIGGRIVSDGRAVAHFLSNKGVDHLTDGMPQSAIAYFRKALESDPTMAAAWANMGAAQTIIGEYAEAEKSYLQAMKLDPGELAAMSNLAALYQRLGRDHDARRYLAKVRRFNEMNPYYHFNLGLRAYQSGEYRGSIEHYRAALRRKSTEHNFHLAIAKSYARLGQMNKATESLRLALKNAPDDASRIRYSEKLAMLASR